MDTSQESSGSPYLNRAQRRAQAAFQRKMPQRVREWQARDKLAQQKKAAAVARENKLRRRKLAKVMEKKKEQAPKLGILQTHLFRRRDRNEKKKDEGTK